MMRHSIRVRLTAWYAGLTLVALIVMAVAVLALVIVLSATDGDYGAPAALGAAAVVLAGPVAYAVARRL